MKLVAPFWIIEPADIRMKSNELVSIDCKADGNPKPVVSWKSSDGEIFRDETLTLSPTKSKSIFYECIADNGIGKPLKKVIRILLNGEGFV